VSAWIEIFDPVLGKWARFPTSLIESLPPIPLPDHGALPGLADDDHAQYHNDTRGDARYVKGADHTTAAHDALGIDADTVDGQDASDFAPSGFGLGVPLSGEPITDADAATLSGFYWVSTNTNCPPGAGTYYIHAIAHSAAQYVHQICSGADANIGLFTRSRIAGAWGAWRKVWDDTNDGTGSGLDADLLDGNHASVFAPLADPSFTTKITTPQVQFPAAQSASADVNNLDDYEEGTWTPVASFNGGNGTRSHSSQIGDYVKIGKQVTVSWYLEFDKGTAAGNLTITGLPFAAANSYSGASMRHSGIKPVAIIQAYLSGSLISMEQLSAAGAVASVTVADINAGTVSTLGFATYFV